MFKVMNHQFGGIQIKSMFEMFQKKCPKKCTSHNLASQEEEQDSHDIITCNLLFYM